MSGTPPSARTKVKRLHQRAQYDKESLYRILDAGLLCHVGYIIDGAPYVTPTLYWREGDRVYWHGSSASRMLRKTAGMEVCLTVSHLDGLVLARSGFHSSVNYRSAMLFGTAEKVADPKSKLADNARFWIGETYYREKEFASSILEYQSKKSHLLMDSMQVLVNLRL